MIDLGPLDDRIDLATGRSLPACRHGNAEPVRLLDGGELVAWLCPDCDEQLPAEFTPAAKTADGLAEQHTLNHHGAPFMRVLGCPSCAQEIQVERGVLSPDDVRRMRL